MNSDNIQKINKIIHNLNVDKDIKKYLTDILTKFNKNELEHLANMLISDPQWIEIIGNIYKSKRDAILNKDGAELKRILQEEKRILKYLEEKL